MILIDTGPIVASFDKNDNYHNICLELFGKFKSPLITTIPVLTESFYLLGFSWKVQDALWEFIEQGGLRICRIDGDQLMECRKLMKTYQSLPMDLADASLVVAAEMEKVHTVFTLDHRDFKVYRTRQNKRFALLPSEL